MKKALENLTVIDLTRVLAGPYCTMLLGDYGANVIKVEAPETGDDSRAFGPFQNNESAYFMSINRNKRSITLNLKSEEGKKILKDLVKTADIIVENFRPGTMEKLGLGYDVLKEINPEIIYAAASGFGHTGPYSERAAYDAVVQAMGGIMSITGEKGGKPVRVGTSIGDITAGLFTTIGILSALNYRRETGKGQKVDVSMLDCQVAILENAISRYLMTGVVPKPAGNKHPSIIPFETFPTVDGDIMIAAGNNSLFQKMYKAMDCQACADPKFATNPLRNDNYDELKVILDEAFSKKTTEEWIEIMEEAGVPNSSVNSIDKVITNPQVIARDMIADVVHPVAGSVKMPGIAIKMDQSPGSIDAPSPTLGQHTDEILKELGYSDADIAALKEKNVF